jgi:hypothetical protein
MANDFALIHIYVGDNASAHHRVATALNEHLAASGYTPVAEASLNPYDPRLNLVEQRSRSFYISTAAQGWVSVADEDIFRLDEPTAESLLTNLSAIGPAILLWGIDQFVWGYTCVADWHILDRYTEDFIELDAYNPTFLHAPSVSVEQQGPRYAGKPQALAQLLDESQTSNLKPQTSNLDRAEHYISGYHAYYRRTADNELTYMDELIGGAGQIYADAWVKELAANLGIIQPDITYPAMVQAEAKGELPTGWQVATYRRPITHQPNYSVALTIYCERPLSGQVIVWLLTSVTNKLPKVGKQGWTEIEMAGTYYPNAAAAIAQLEDEGLAEGEHLAARYYPGCNLVVQRRGDDLPLDVIFLEYPSIIDDSYTPDVLERAPEVAALQDFVLSGRLGGLATRLFELSNADYGYISVAGGGVGGDGGGRANGPGAMLADALAKPLVQLSSRMAVKEAASWRQRWGQLDRAVRGVYWANLLSPAQLEHIGNLASQPGRFVVDDAGTGVAYVQLSCTLAEYADGKAEADIGRLRDALLPLLEL